MEPDCGSFLNSCTCPQRRSRLRPRTATLNMSGMVLSAEAGHVLQPLLFLDPLQDLLFFLSAFSHHFFSAVLFKKKKKSLAVFISHFEKKKRNLERRLTLISHMVASLLSLVLIEPC